jgi:hypothetical protein
MELTPRNLEVLQHIYLKQREASSATCNDESRAALTGALTKNFCLPESRPALALKGAECSAHSTSDALSQEGASSVATAFAASRVPAQVSSCSGAQVKARDSAVSSKIAVPKPRYPQHYHRESHANDYFYNLFVSQTLSAMFNTYVLCAAQA